MSQFSRSPYIELNQVKKSHFADDCRTGDRYKISPAEREILDKALPTFSIEQIIGTYRGTLKQIQIMTSVQKLIHIGALIPQDDFIKQGSPFMPAEGCGMFGVEISTPVRAKDPQIVFVGMPWDFRYGLHGAASGPKTLRTASQYYQYAFSKTKGTLSGWYSFRYMQEILEGVKILDLGDFCAPLITDYNILQPVIADGVRQIYGAQTFPVFVGGDHGLTYLILRAIDIQPFVLVHIDAHDDFNEGERLNHGTYLRYAARLDNLQSIHLAGVRGVAPVKRGKELKRSGMQYLTTDAWRAGHAKEFIERLPALPLYISLDVDVMDPAYAPATHTVRGGGVTPSEVIEFLQILGKRHKVIALDLMELSLPVGKYDYSAHYMIEILIHFLHDLLTSNNIFNPLICNTDKVHSDQKSI